MDEMYYRLRPINEHTLESFLFDIISATRQTNFNDPYDGYITFDVSKIKKLIPLGLNSIELNTNLNDANINKFIVDRIKSNFFVLSFTKKIDNQVMWAHYADNGKGFALGYSQSTIDDIKTWVQFRSHGSALKLYDKNGNFDFIDDSIKWYSELAQFKEVKYCEETINFTDLIEQNIEYFDECIINGINLALEINEHREGSFYKTLIQHGIFTKDKRWEYESEYRLFMRDYIKNGNSYLNLLVHKPDALFIGEFTPLVYKKILVKFANDKGLKIYTMITDTSLSINKLKPILMDQITIDKILDIK